MDDFSPNKLRKDALPSDEYPKMEFDAKQLAKDPTYQPVPLSEYRDSSINIRNTISTESQFATWMSTLVDPMVPNQ